MCFFGSRSTAKLLQDCDLPRHAPNSAIMRETQVANLGIEPWCQQFANLVLPTLVMYCYYRRSCFINLSLLTL